MTSEITIEPACKYLQDMLKRIALVFVLCLLFSQTTSATTITIAATTVNPTTTYPTTPYPTTPTATATLRIYSSITFTAADGTVVMGSTAGSGAFFKSVTCTIASGTINCPSFTLPSTNDALDNANSARYTAVFYDSRGVKRDTFLADFVLPNFLAGSPNNTWAQIRVYKSGVQPLRDTSTYTKTQTDAQIAPAAGTLNDASTTVKGRVKLSVAPASSTKPIAVGDNDPRLTSYFNVVTYGADKTGVADSLTAFNAAINACNAAGVGAIYVPFGIFKLTATTQTITCTGSLFGEGMFGAATVFPTNGASQINFTSASTNAFNIGSTNFVVRNISLSNTAGSTPSAGYGFYVTGSNIYQKVDFERVTVHRFYNNIRESGGLWVVKNCVLSSAVNRQLESENLFNPDVGDALIDGNWFINAGVFPPVAIKVKSGGGMKITNNKILEAVQGIEVDVASTTILLITGNSIEKITGNAIKITGPPWGLITIVSNEIMMEPTNTTKNAILLNGVSRVTISDLVISSGAPGLSAIGLGTSTNVKAGPITIGTFGRKFQTDGLYTGEPLPDGAPAALSIVANAISPEYQTFHLGAGLLKTINTTFSYETVMYRIIPDAAFTYDGSGNILVPAGGGRAVTNRVMDIICYRGDKCYPSY